MAAIITILAFIFIIGLVTGSFLNVVILRTISGESIIFPASHCPKCNTPLKWYHNIPLLSYIFLGGKCAYCKEVISLQYPAVELLTGLIFLWFGFMYIVPILNFTGGSIVYLFMFIFSLIASCLFIVISGTDILEMKVSNAHLYTLIGTGILYSIIIGSIAFYSEYEYGNTKIMLILAPIISTILSAIAAFIFMEILRRGANFLLKTETLGDGDSYIFAGIAAVLTSMFGGYDVMYLITLMLCVFLGSVIIGVIFTLPKYIKSIISKKNWYLLCLLSAFIIYACGYFYGDIHGWLNGTASRVICTIILAAIGLALCCELLKGLKDNTQEHENMLPFGPALCITGFIALVALPVLLGFV